MKIRTCPLFDKQLKIVKKSGLWKKIGPELVNFIKTKQSDTQQAFGKRDKTAPAGSVHKNVMPNVRHSPLHKDRSIFYFIEDNILHLFGIFTHQESGTDGNIRVQKAFVQKLENQVDKFVPPDELINDLKSVMERIFAVRRKL